MQYRKLGRYHLGKSLAQGGMGEIIRSSDDFGRPLALKTILPQFQNEPNIRELFQREAEITFSLDHPNIVRAYQFQNIGHQLVLALEYLDGVNVKDILKQCYDRKMYIPLVVLVAIMKGVLSGLDYAHKKRDSKNRKLGIVHRDLNPANVFVTYTGDVKILDFGISKATRKDVHQLTPPGELRGKLCYLSPEQVKEQKLDHRSDIFSCGILLWELLTGRPLFFKDDDVELMEDIMQARYRAAADYRADISSELEAVLKKALQKNPYDRFKDCAEMSRALDQAARKLIMPGSGEEEIAIFVRSLFRKGTEEANAEFKSGFAWLLTQIKGQENAGLEMAKRIAELNSTQPFVQLNYARCLIAAGDRKEGLRNLRRLARVESLESVSQEILEWLGVRRTPVVPFLHRSNVVNHLLGRVRHKILGPTPYQQQFLAA